MNPADLKHLLATPMYRRHLDDYLEEPRRGARFPAFMLFAHEVLGWFERDAALLEVKLTCVTLAQVQRQPLHVLLRHHFALTSERTGPARPLVEDVDRFALEHLPWRGMSEGSLAVHRAGPLVQRLLALPSDPPDQREELVFTLARDFDLAFAEVEVAHDLGWRR